MSEPLTTLDINCDVGESFGRYLLGNDEALMPWISSANIACGFHGGDPSVMAKTVRLALSHRVSIGVHPGLPDLAGFGRRWMSVSPEEVEAMVLYQIGALAAFTRAEGGELHHVKPHGALYHMAGNDPSLAAAIARAVHRFDASLKLYAMAGSQMVAIGRKHGLRVVEEVFIDRRYRSGQALVPRKEIGAVIDSEISVIGQLQMLLDEGVVKTDTGERCAINAQTLCLHGDHPESLRFAEKAFQCLEEQGISVSAP